MQKGLTLKYDILENWPYILRETIYSPTCEIITKNGKGKLNTIILAALSPFLEHILSSLPPFMDGSIVLPDMDWTEVSTFLNNVSRSKVSEGSFSVSKTLVTMLGINLEYFNEVEVRNVAKEKLAKNIDTTCINTNKQSAGLNGKLIKPGQSVLNVEEKDQRAYMDTFTYETFENSYMNEYNKEACEGQNSTSYCEDIFQNMYEVNTDTIDDNVTESLQNALPMNEEDNNPFEIFKPRSNFGINRKSRTKKDQWEKCNRCDDSIPLQNINSNDNFCCESYVRSAIADFSDNFHHPFQIKSTEQDNPARGVRAKLVYKCTHGVDNSSRRRQPRVRQRQARNYTGCVAQITIRKQKSGRWVVRTCTLDHVNKDGLRAHATGGKIYASYSRVKNNVEEVVKNHLMEFGGGFKVNSPIWKIADHVSQETGLFFTEKDIRNRITKYLQKEIGRS